jgi:hypothetical protein
VAFTRRLRELQAFRFNAAIRYLVAGFSVLAKWNVDVLEFDNSAHPTEASLTTPCQAEPLEIDTVLSCLAYEVNCRLSCNGFDQPCVRMWNMELEFRLSRFVWLNTYTNAEDVNKKWYIRVVRFCWSSTAKRMTFNV